MNKKKVAIIRELKYDLNNKLNGLIKEVVLFGSQVDDKASENSDYDILIIIDAEVTPLLKDEINSVCYEIDLKYNIITDTHILSIHELHSLRGKQPVFSEAINNGIYV